MSTSHPADDLFARREVSLYHQCVVRRDEGVCHLLRPLRRNLGHCTMHTHESGVGIIGYDLVDSLRSDLQLQRDAFDDAVNSFC